MNLPGGMVHSNWGKTSGDKYREKKFHFFEGQAESICKLAKNFTGNPINFVSIEPNSYQQCTRCEEILRKREAVQHEFTINGFRVGEMSKIL